MPYGVAPNFKINNEIYAVPMVIEESSVVAAAASAAKYWMSRGGFKATVLSTTKIGQVHFFWHGDPMLIKSIFPKLKQKNFGCHSWHNRKYAKARRGNSADRLA